MKKTCRYLRVLSVLFSGMFLLISCGSDKVKGAAAPPEVGIITLKPQKITLTTELPGRTRPFRVAEVRPQVSGIILKRQFVEGSDVKAGQSLYQIDPATYQTTYDSAKGDLAKAEANAEITRLTVNRYKPLLGTNYVSHHDYDTAVANSKQGAASVVGAKAALENARINLHYTKVLSPISGRIGKSAVTEGALVTANQSMALASVQQLNPIYVDLTQSSNDFLNLKRQLAKGDLSKGADSVLVDLILDDGFLYSQQGTLQFSDVTVDETTGSITLRAIFPNKNQELLPGMFVRARIKEGVKQDAILAPQQGVTRNARGEAIALIVDDKNKVVERTLITGQALGDKWLIVSGLKGGDRLIVTGQQKIKSGMTVKVVEAEESPEAMIAKDKAATNKSIEKKRATK